MNTYISEVHKEAIEEYINSSLKKRHLNMPNIDSYTEFRIKQLAKDMFYAGYKDALKTEELKKDEYVISYRDIDPKLKELVERFEMETLKGIDNPEILKKINKIKNIGYIWYPNNEY